MTQESLKTQLTRIIVDQLAVDPTQVTPEARLKEDLGADSLDSVEICLGIEEELYIRLEEEDMVNFQTFGEILAHVEKIHRPRPI